MIVVIVLGRKKKPTEVGFCDGLSDPLESEYGREIFLGEFVDPDPTCAGGFVWRTTTTDGAGFATEIGDDVSNSDGFEGLGIDESLEV